MAKRFTDTEIWNQDWIFSCPLPYIAFWSFIRDKCNHAGIWKPNKCMFESIARTEISLDKALEIFNGDKQRIRVLPNRNWVIEDFINFQYGQSLSLSSNSHRSVLKLLLENNIDLKSVRGLVEVKDWDNRPLSDLSWRSVKALLEVKLRSVRGKVDHTPRAKDKDKDSVVVVEEEGMGEETKPATPKKFTPPTALEVTKYADSLNFPLDGETFIAYYQARGWKDIKDWKACVVTWKKNAPKFNGKADKDAADLYESRKKYGRCTICGQKLRIENGLKLCLACEPQNLSTPAIPLVIKPIRDGPT